LYQHKAEKGTCVTAFGVMHPYANTNDHGRAEITHGKADRYWFTVPSLRNVELAEPYFHDGKVPTLREAAGLLGYLPLKKELSDTESPSIEAFLSSLSDKRRARQ